MRVLVFDGPHRFHIEDRSLPEPGSGEVRIRVARVGICGSDLHGYTGESGRRHPGMVMGHEASGWLEALGPDVGGLRIGELVTFNPELPCDGSCGHTAPNRCSRLRVIGVTPDIQGAFADAIVVPADRIVGAGGLTVDRAAAAEPMAVAIQASRRAEVGVGDDVVVLGGGMIGQCVAQAARVAGATSITVSDPLPERRQIAAHAGFEVIHPAQVEERAPFDRAIDAVGVSATAAASIKAVRVGGTICFVGLGRPEVSIPLFDVVVAERMIAGSFGYSDGVFREAVTRLGEGSLDLGPLIGSVVDFEDAPQVFEDLARDARRDVKILVSTGADPPA
ncbi:MAG: zinc-binding dehydrogenase [Acidimicrobiia bacterium]